MVEPLAPLSSSRQNSRPSPFQHEKGGFLSTASPVNDSTILPPTHENNLESTQTSYRPLSPPDESTEPAQSPRRALSPIKYRLQDNIQVNMSPPGSPAESTIRFNEGLTQACKDFYPQSQPTYSQPSSPTEAQTPSPRECNDTGDHTPQDIGDELDLTLNIDDKAAHDETFGDLSSISAIPADMTRFADILKSPSKTPRPGPWSPSKQLRETVASTPATVQRPLRLLSGSRHSSSSNEDEEATPRQQRSQNDTLDLMNFTGTTNIVIPPPSSSSRSSRRSPSGRGPFPIRINPSPTHKSQASLDRERAGGRSSQQSYFPERSVPATPSTNRHSMQTSSTGHHDLLDIDLEPMATPRSIPSITPRELETLRSELQSRISGLEATLSGKEAEVMALKRAVTDAEVRVGKTSEDLRTERAAREETEHHKHDLERRSRELENMLRDLKQNAFMEEREREKLRRQAEDAEHRVEDQEVKILELNASLDTLRVERFKSSAGSERMTHPATPGTNVDIDYAVKDATEKVARELHVLYKGKHERKVSDLKVSYEKRWIKQVDQLKVELKQAQEEISRLKDEKASTRTGVVPGQAEAMSRMEGQIEELRRWNEETNGDKKALEADMISVKEQLVSANVEIDTLHRDLEQERIEKGELVAQVDLFLTMSAQQEVQQPNSPLQHQPVSPPRSEDGRPGSAAAMAIVSPSPNKFRNSINSTPASMIAPPAANNGSNASGRARPLSMLQRPAGGKFSSFSGVSSGLKMPSNNNGSNIGRSMAYGGKGGGIMENISRMGAGGR